MTFEQGDIVAAEILFSSQIGSKLRPALVMSTKSYNSSSFDIVVFKITSKGKSHPFDVPLTQKDLEEGTLKMDSVIQADFPVVIEKQLAKKIGKVKSGTIGKVKKRVLSLFGI